MKYCQIDILVQGSVGFGGETQEEFMQRVNTRAKTLKAYDVRLSHVDRVRLSSVHEDRDFGNETHYTYESFHEALILYLQETEP